MKTFIKYVFLILVAGPLSLLSLVAVMVLLLAGWPWPPSDAEMLAVLNERRPSLEALVAKLSEGRATGRIDDDWMDSGADVGPWLVQVRALMREVGAKQVSYYGRDEPIEVIYGWWGFRGGWNKSFAYRHEPPNPAPLIIDLHGEGAAARARAALCDPDRPADLRHLCKDGVWVNDLDALNDADDGSGNGIWVADRPIDAHWSLRMTWER